MVPGLARLVLLSQVGLRSRGPSHYGTQPDSSNRRVPRSLRTSRLDHHARVSLTQSSSDREFLLSTPLGNTSITSTDPGLRGHGTPTPLGTLRRSKPRRESHDALSLDSPGRETFEDSEPRREHPRTNQARKDET